MVSVCFKLRTVAILLVLILYVLFIYFGNGSQLDFNAAMFLTKNSLREFKQRLSSKKIITPITGPLQYEGDSEYPFNNVFNSLFPIDATFEFNTTHTGNITTHKFTGRYASFSAILSSELTSQYRFLSENACTSVSVNDGDQNKIIIVSRGDCNFVSKVLNIIDSNAKPKAIIIANNEPYRGLVTMFSNAFNQDGALTIPIVFITFEDGQLLKSMQNEVIILQMKTAAIGDWLSILLSIVLSPPLLIILIYVIILCGQRVRERQINKRNTELVKNLPVYVYNDDQLILESDFEKYRGMADQGTFTDSTSYSKSASRKKLRILSSPNDYFRAFKCSICLERYEPLKSRVLVLECKHMHHQKCLSRWLINFRRSCPLCNNTILKDNLLSGHEVTYGSFDMENGVTEGSSREIEVQRPFDYRSMSSQRSFQRPLLISRPSAILNCYNSDCNGGAQLSTSIDSV
ncbi:late-stage biofilm-induced gene in C. albicans [Candida orthopsilosis Co 90-125]|uniref:RING-type E3 ubiquitin transferase n=1 Tax=Candida orthopsilosis (strain 90-125) TaxID=1136231 RepID=H8X657_CANO9|nr:late-stage biofilm-induced gene in C. albicans [Candida orthopsilosis Co 90-125]CCG23305.1 late-stage biofilm-induced gene in C. albicans [Candida orthopsilosis Co 90-125]